MSEPKRRLKRDAISRARFFLELARDCSYSGDLSEREAFEAYLEAAIVFGRVAIHRVHGAAKNEANSPRAKDDVGTWWESLRGDPAINFFRNERDFILKQGPPKVGQIVGLGGNEPRKAEELYYYENPDVSAAETVEHHLNAMEKIVVDAEARFGTSTLLGHW